MSASVSCVDFAIFRRSLPTRRVSRTNSGTSANANSESVRGERGHADRSMRPRGHVRDDQRRRARTTLCTPPMSRSRCATALSPVRVRVKNASDAAAGGGRLRCASRASRAGRPGVRKEGLPQREHVPATNRDRDHSRPRRMRASSCVRDDRLQDAAQQERGDDAECRGEEDEREHDRQPAAVSRGRDARRAERSARRTAGSAGRSGFSRIPRNP